MSTLSIMAAERVTIWDPRSWRIRNIFQPKTLPREPKPLSPFFKQVLKVDNTPAFKQLNDLVTEGRVIAREEIAALSKPTPTYTKDRIFAFVESVDHAVSLMDIGAAIPDVTPSGLSSRVSEMHKAGTLARVYIQRVDGSWSFHYTVPETK